jgi:glycosyltransferase involved in cell wall biosynthesis
MKICFVCNEYPPTPHGGIGTFVHTLATFLARQKHDVIVVGFGERGAQMTWEEQGVEVNHPRMPMRWLSGENRYAQAFWGGMKRMVLSKTVNRLASRRCVDVVESYDWSGPLWRHPSVPLVVRMHGANTAHCVYERRRPSRKLKHFERKNLGMADQLIAVSEHIGGLTVRSVGLPNKAYRVIYNAVDTELFRPRDTPRDGNEVLYVGTVNRRKGVEELFKAIPEVLAKRPATRFRIAGAISRSESGESLDQYLLALLPVGCRASVEFLGRIPHEELPSLYNRAAVCVFPSLAEAFGLTCVEAMACGRPVVMTNQASGPEIVEDGLSGLLADPRDSKHVSTCLLSILNNPDLQQRMGKAARKRTEEKFSLCSLAEATLEEYSRVVQVEGRKRER